MNTKSNLLSYLFLSAFLTIISSCSVFINKIDDDLLNKQSVSYKKTNDHPTYCQQKTEFELMSEDESSQKYFIKFLNEQTKKRKFTFADKVVLWALIQMNLRPNHSSPTSKIQFFIKKNGRTFFYNIVSKSDKTAYPYIHGLNTLLDKFGSNYGLKKLASIIDKEYNEQHYVSDYLARFLQTNQKDISKTKVLKRAYIRGDETLKKGERVKKQFITPLISQYLKKQKLVTYNISNYLFDYKKNNLIFAKCNYDMELYDSSIYLIYDQVIKSNTFGLRDKDNIFLADSTQNLNALKSLNNTIFFQGKSDVRSPAMCQFQLPLNKSWDLWLISSHSRDPGQHLFHLIEYGMQDIKKTSQLNNMLKFSRHLFLKKPIRLIFESERSSGNQLNELLKLNIPIYNANKLARIWGYYSHKEENHFILDQRRPGSLSCKKSYF